MYTKEIKDRDCKVFALGGRVVSSPWKKALKQIFIVFAVQILLIVLLNDSV